MDQFIFSGPPSVRHFLFHIPFSRFLRQIAIDTDEVAHLHCSMSNHALRFSTLCMRIAIQ